MRVLQVIPSLGVGGAEVIVALLARELTALDHEVHVASLADPLDTWIERDLRDRGVSVHHLGKRPGLDLRAIPRLRRVLRSVRPDVIHTHLHVLKYVLPAGAPRRRVVHTLHNLAEHEATGVDQRLQRLAFRAGVTPVAIGQAVADSAADVYGRRPAAVIANGIPVPAQRSPKGTRQDVRAELGVSEHTPLFVVVGRLNPQKNHALLLNAMSQVPDAALWIVGDGELRAELEQQAQALGDRVRFLGVRRDVPRLLAAADAFVLPSDWEGNPLVVMEAMAAGLAVAATDVGCVSELVDATTGHVVAAGDLEGLAAALRQLADDPDRTRALGRAGARVADERFDAPVMAAAYAQLYRRVAAW